ncbi:MAG: hypothetical protein ACRETQ_11655, partial [Gammaproteobacteria bacterium]
MLLPVVCEADLISEAFAFRFVVRDRTGEFPRQGSIDRLARASFAALGAIGAAARIGRIIAWSLTIPMTTTAAASDNVPFLAQKCGGGGLDLV